MFDLKLIKKDFPLIEEHILNFWQEDQTFAKSIANRQKSSEFTFYDGPPFATGLPHYGHILAGTTKDVIPRYQTMKGHYIPRKFGWDCHGLPVEYEMEKELKLSGRKDIETYGVKNFCESCRSIVLRYTSEWEKTVERMGRWVDFKNDYKTMDPDYMESILWVFKSLWDKGLIYEGHKSMHVCPRCATTLSNFEVTLGYKDVDDVSVVAKFGRMQEYKDIDLRRPENDDEWDKYHDIRKKELFEGFHQDDKYDKDHADEQKPNNHPMGLFYKGKMIGTARIDFLDEKRAAFRLVAISSELQRNGFGTTLLKLAEQFAKRNGRNIILLHSVATAVDFYRKNGYTEMPWDEDPRLPDSVDMGRHIKRTYFLAWTTTPWTLPSNILLAVGKDIDYVKVETDTEKYILARDLLPKFAKLLGDEPKITKKYKGKDLVGKKYIPLFDCAQHLEGKKFEVVLGDFVSTEDGTGIVHIAPAFGDDDLKLGQKLKAPFFQPLSIDGVFTKEAPDFLQGKEARASNKEIRDYLNRCDLLFDAQNHHHSYPHCWRCDSPLLNFATSSFFVDVLKIKNKLVKSNQRINWVPEHIKTGRFGKWLDNARDWSISRNRFWGAPIPLWRCADCGETEVLHSVKEMSEKGIKKGKIMVARHGEGEHNIQDVIISKQDTPCSLTVKGQKQAQKLGKSLSAEKIDLIISSPLERTQETAEIIAKELKGSTEIIFDDRIREIDAGKMEGCSIDDWLAQFKDENSRYYDNPHCGESKADVDQRVREFLAELYQKHGQKNILIITHGAVLRMITKFFHNLDVKTMFSVPVPKATLSTFSFSAVPTNDFGEIDLHRPYIDQVQLPCKCGGVMKRIPDVLDCWFESGSMPYAERHYPFQNKKKFEQQFPADFISESLDQTRGWFYTLHVLANGLFDTEAFKNCIVSGIVLAEDGQKMSKSKKNYPDPELIFSKFGADAMRFYLMSSPLMKADDLCFSERGVQEILRRVFLPLKNSYIFFASLANITEWGLSGQKSKSKLDRWILAELRQTIKNISRYMDEYQVDLAAREIPEFMEKLTNFYIRRSRRRFWNEENEAFETLFTVLIHVCQILAPFSPFFTEAVYRELKEKMADAPHSVHLTDWPDYKKFDSEPKLIEEISAVRTIVSLGLAIRAQEKIRVRQPLQKVQIALPPRLKAQVIKDNEDIIKEELNIKEIEILDNPQEIAQKIVLPDARKLGPRLGKEVQKVIQMAKNGEFTEMKNGDIKVNGHILKADEVEISFLGKKGFGVQSEQGIVLALDTNLSPELLEEGFAREIIRHLQDMRKEADYQISDRILISVKGADDILVKHQEQIMSEVLADKISNLDHTDLVKEIEIEGQKVELKVKR